MSSNIETVKQMYEAFGRQDIPAILSKLTEDVEWEYGIEHTNVPWLQERKGRDAALGFFEVLAGLDISYFEPKKYFESNDIVVALLDVKCTVKDTGIFVHNQDETHTLAFQQGRHGQKIWTQD